MKYKIIKKEIIMIDKEFEKKVAEKELSKLDLRLKLVLEEVQDLQNKIASDVKVSAEDLDIVVKDLDQLHRIMGDRRDVGH